MCKAGFISCWNLVPDSCHELGRLCLHCNSSKLGSNLFTNHETIDARMQTKRSWLRQLENWTTFLLTFCKDAGCRKAAERLRDSSTCRAPCTHLTIGVLSSSRDSTMTSCTRTIPINTFPISAVRRGFILDPTDPAAPAAGSSLDHLLLLLLISCCRNLMTRFAVYCQSTSTASTFASFVMIDWSHQYYTAAKLQAS